MQHTHDRRPEAAAPFEELVRSRLARRVGEELARAIPAEEKFYDLGIDSLDIVTTLAVLERECGVERIADGELWDIADSVRALAGYLAEHATSTPGEIR